jgi:hypothetical protein
VVPVGAFLAVLRSHFKRFWILQQQLVEHLAVSLSWLLDELGGL